MKPSFPEKAKHLLLNWQTALVGIILIEFIVFGSRNAKFLRPAMLAGSMNDFMSICIISLFVTFVMITGGIDIQAGSIVGLTSIIIGVTWQDFNCNIWVSALIALVAAAACGALSGFFIAYCGVQAMVVTLGGSFLYAGIALLVSNMASTAAYQGISGFPDYFKVIAKTKFFGIIPSQLVIFLLLAVLAYIVLHRTKYGRSIFLVGVNQKAAEYSGVNTRLVIMSTYIISALSAAVAGIVLTAYLGTAKSDLGANFTLNIITAVVLGGTLSTGGKGNVAGTALASLAIGLMRFGLPLCFDRRLMNYLDIPVGFLLLIVVLARAASSHPAVQKWAAGLRRGGK